MRISLIGPGDMKYHFEELLKMKPQELEKHLSEIATALSNSGCDIVLTPDKGVSLEVAKQVKDKKSGVKIYGTVPKSDVEYGIRHIQPYMNEVVDGVPLFDELIDAGNWYKLDVSKAATGDVVLVLGKSLGAIGELALGFYIYKLLTKKKPGVQPKSMDIGNHIRAGKTLPFSAIIYLPFARGKLDYELEAYIKKVGGRVYYVNKSAELEETFKKLKAEYEEGTVSRDE
ncbi:MAG: hypothetical protein JW727_00690 [Candidatus Aenigmarchaeota archaeon]|nr:hypothetical protein [Candidatus Aenigmarchaeota archaeon]